MEHDVMTNRAETAERKTRGHPSCRQMQLTADQQYEPEPEAYHSAEIARSCTLFYVTLFAKVLMKVRTLDSGPKIFVCHCRPFKSSNPSESHQQRQDVGRAYEQAQYKLWQHNDVNVSYNRTYNNSTIFIRNNCHKNNVTQ
jgi:hypothetical protein